VNVPNGPKNPTLRAGPELVVEVRALFTPNKATARDLEWQDDYVDQELLRTLLDDVSSGRIAPDDAVELLKRLPYRQVDDTLVDHHRHLRQGSPEAVYGPGKSPEQCVSIVGELLANGSGAVLVTRTDEKQRAALEAAHGITDSANGSMLWRAPSPIEHGNVLVISAGTADVPVVDECLLALRAHGITASRITDVGVAGLHRLLDRVDDVMDADIIVVVAGMEGALASVIGGLSGKPVIAVPTSVGYGSGLDGVTALLAMHATCANGITVVGIDNGYGAACAVARIVRG
jgi:NCAIR mutase (PurE)-related protein